MENKYPKACKTIQDLNIGDTIKWDYTISYEDVKKFSEICGDWNPVHHDPEFAKQTIFKKQIAHGMISVSKFSGILGMEMPGLGTVYLNQHVNFCAPVYLDTPMQAIMTITAVDIDTNTVNFDTKCIDNEGKEVLTGTAQAKPIPQKVRDKMDLPIV